MAGTVGPNPVTGISPIPALPRGGLYVGQLLRGTVQGEPGNFVLHVGDVALPLPDNPALVAGQTVTAQVVQTDAGLQLRVLPEDSAPAANTSLVADAFPQIFDAVLSSLGASEPAETAVLLTPSALPQKEPLLKTLLSVFVARDSLGADLKQLAGLIREAAQQGAIPALIANEFESAVTAASVSAEATLGAALERAARNGGENAEARLAKALASGVTGETQQQLAADLHNLVGVLSQTADLRDFLGAAGKLTEFDRAVERTLNRLSGVQMQNLRSLEAPYWFFEIPFDPDGPIRHAQIHILADGRGSRRSLDPEAVTVAFDISTSRLGDLWISLRIAAGRCDCWFRATTPESIKALETASHELRANLERIGYPGTAVHVAHWNGNRMEEAANLMRRFAGINVTA